MIEGRVGQERKRPAHGVHVRDGEPMIVFVTTCAKDRVCWMANDIVHGVCRTVWAEARGWLVGRYVVMPDHIHLFVSPGEMDCDLEVWMRYWKRLVTQRIGNGKRWQSSHWDTRMRCAHVYAEKWNYVRHNPVRKALAAEPDDWPYQGEVFELPWR